MANPERTMDPIFDPHELGDRLGANPIPRLHSTHSQGFRYQLGADAEAPQADLEVYPDTSLVRFTSEGLQVSLRSPVMGAAYTREGVAFEGRGETERRYLRISQFGEIFLSSALHPPLDRFDSFDRSPDQQTATDEQPAIEAPEPVGEPTQGPAGTSVKEQDKQQRVVLRGKAGRDATLRETAKGVKIAKFPLAVYETEEGSDQEVTMWHTVVCFNGLASKVSETVKKGQDYTVEVYASTVRPPSKKQQSDSEATAPRER